MKLFLAFTLIPAIEIYLLIKIGQEIGGLETFGLILLTGIVGAQLARSQGFALLQKVQKEAQQGFPSNTTLAEGLLILIGGVLLITPGVITDGIGLLFIFPLSRKLLAPRVLRGLEARANVHYAGGFHMGGGFPASGFPANGPTSPDPESPDDKDPSSRFKHPIQ